MTKEEKKEHKRIKRAERWEKLKELCKKFWDIFGSYVTLGIKYIVSVLIAYIKQRLANKNLNNDPNDED